MCLKRKQRKKGNRQKREPEANKKDKGEIPYKENAKIGEPTTNPETPKWVNQQQTQKQHNTGTHYKPRNAQMGEPTPNLEAAK